MAIEAAKLLVSIGADLHELEDGLGHGETALTSFAGKLGKVGLKLTAAISTPAMLAAKSIFQVGASLEQSQIAFTTMLGSGERAKAFLEELRDFSKATPFEFMELQDAAKRMMAFGFAAERVVPMLTDIGDAAAGLGIGAAGVDRITLALGQMQAKSKVSGQEMMQLTEAGIPAWRYLAEAMGKSTAEVMKMSEQGLIPAEQAIQAILAGMRQNFGGLMAEQAQTASGQLSNLSDELNSLAADLSQIILPVAKDLVGVAREAVQWLGALPDSTKRSVVELVGLAAAAGPVMMGLSGIASSISPFIRGVAGLATVSGEFAAAITLLKGAKLGELFSLASMGAGGLAAALIPVGLAVGSIVAVWAQWNKQITQTNKEGVSAVKTAWGDFFDSTIKNGADAVKVLEEYRAAQARVQEQLRFSLTDRPAIESFATLFIDKQSLMQASTEELSQAILASATSYAQYTEVMRQADLEMYTVSELQYNLSRGLDITGASAQAAAGNMDQLAASTMAGSEAMDILVASARKSQTQLQGLVQEYDSLQQSMQSWITETASQVQNGLNQWLPESSERYRQALAALDSVMNTNYLSQLQQRESIQALTREYARTGDLDAFTTGLKRIKDEGLADMQEKLEEVTQKAQDLYDKLMQLPAELRIQINFDVEALPKWLTAAIPSGGSGTRLGRGTVEPRAAGGPVLSNTPYLVGENGPELFVPQVNGTIVPNAGAINITMNVAIDRDMDIYDTAYALAQEIRRRQ